jgi:hypothetical protein
MASATPAVNVEVGVGGLVGDDDDVELSGVRHGTDPDGDVAQDRHDGEHLLHAGARQVEGRGGSGDVGDVRVRHVLVVEATPQDVLREAAADEGARWRSVGVVSELFRAGSDPFEPRPRVTDGKG